MTRGEMPYPVICPVGIQVWLQLLVASSVHIPQITDFETKAYHSADWDKSGDVHG